MCRTTVHVKTARNFPYNQSYNIYYKLQCSRCIKMCRLCIACNLQKSSAV